MCGKGYGVFGEGKGKEDVRLEMLAGEMFT